MRTGSLPLQDHFSNHRSKCVMSRRGFAFRGVAAAGLSVVGSSSSATEPAQGIEGLPFKPEGYNFWTWRGHKIHYVMQGEGPAVLLIHGFGASSFHLEIDDAVHVKLDQLYSRQYPSKMSCPLLLLWGDLEPWVGPAKANRIKSKFDSGKFAGWPLSTR